MKSNLVLAEPSHGLMCVTCRPILYCPEGRQLLGHEESDEMASLSPLSLDDASLTAGDNIVHDIMTGVGAAGVVGSAGVGAYTMLPKSTLPNPTAGPNYEMTDPWGLVGPIDREESAAELEGVEWLAKSLGEVLYGIGNIPARMMQGSEQLRTEGMDPRQVTDDPRAQTFDPSGFGDAIMLAAGGGPQAAERGAVGVFGGDIAAANLAKAGMPQPQQALSLARKLEKQGATREEIYDQTNKILKNTPFAGAHKGADGKWRFEMSDDLMRARPPYLEEGQSPPAYYFGEPALAHAVGQFSPLQEQVDHYLFQEAYPKTKNYGAIIEETKGLGRQPAPAGGAFDPKGKKLYVGGPEARLDALSSHELQHLAQKVEGFAPGTSLKEQEDLVRRSRPLWKRGAPLTAEEKQTALENYDRAAGEVEARNTQDRILMDPELRRETPPWLSEEWYRADLPQLTPSRKWSGLNYVFGGRVAADNLAKQGILMPKRALDFAEYMAGQGASKEEIYKTTSQMMAEAKLPYGGVHRDKAGNLLFEISDEGLKVTQGGWTKLGDKVQHPELQKAYPRETRSEALAIKTRPGSPFAGQFDERWESPLTGRLNPAQIEANALTMDDLREVLAHEFDHFAGSIEGRPTGTNPQAAMQQIEKAKPELDPAMRELLGHDMYNRATGEVYARNAEKRLRMTPEMRQKYPPWLTEDVPPEQQLIIPQGHPYPQDAKQPTLGQGAQPLHPEDQLSTERLIAPMSPRVREIQSIVEQANKFRDGGNKYMADLYQAAARAKAIEHGFEGDPMQWAWPGEKRPEPMRSVAPQPQKPEDYKRLFTKPELDALKKYSAGANTDISFYLQGEGLHRFGLPPFMGDAGFGVSRGRWGPEGRRPSASSIRDMIGHLDSAMARSPLPQDTVLWRGTDTPLKYSQVPAQVGQTFSIPTFWSTSLDADKALTFAGTSSIQGAKARGLATGNPILLKITAPAGTPSVPINLLSPSSEKEILLPRDARYEVVNQYVIDGYRHVQIVELRILPYEGPGEIPSGWMMGATAGAATAAILPDNTPSPLSPGGTPELMAP